MYKHGLLRSRWLDIGQVLFLCVSLSHAHGNFSSLRLKFSVGQLFLKKNSSSVPLFVKIYLMWLSLSSDSLVCIKKTHLAVYPAGLVLPDSDLWERAVSPNTSLPVPCTELWPFSVSWEVPVILGVGADMPDVESGRWSMVSFLSGDFDGPLSEVVSPSLISSAVESLTTSTLVSLN